jgi:TonB family protein
MLQHLIESHPTERRWLAVTPAATTSAAAHGIALAAWVWLVATGAAVPAMPDDTVRAQFVGIAPEEETRALPPEPPPVHALNTGGTAVRAAPKYLPGTGNGPVVGDRPAGFQELVVPTVDRGIPLLDSTAQVAVRAEDFSGRGVVGGVGAGKPPEGPIARTASEVGTAADSIGPGAGGSGPPIPRGGTAGGDWYDAADLEEPPVLANGDYLARILPRLYPPTLRKAGIGGVVMVEFLVDTAGLVEPRTITILSSPNDLLTEASRRALQMARFVPGRIRYRGRTVAVQVRVNMPVEWALIR